MLRIHIDEPQAVSGVTRGASAPAGAPSLSTIGLLKIESVARGARRGRGSAGRQTGELKTWEPGNLLDAAVDVLADTITTGRVQF